MITMRSFMEAARDLLFLICILCLPCMQVTALEFPGESWNTTTPLQLGWDQESLNQAIELAHTNRSSALVISKNGRLVVEEYWQVMPKSERASFAWLQFDTLPGGEVVEDVASMRKSVVAVLALIAREKVLLDFEVPVSEYLGVGWSKATPAQESLITVRHLMNMTSGLDIHAAFEAPAGTLWRYDTNVYRRMVGVLEASTGKDVASLKKEWLADPVGIAFARDGALIGRAIEPDMELKLRSCTG